jgi:hypothetical protein
MEEWVNPLISASAGVLGAFVGAGGTLLVSRREARAAVDREHREALVGFYAAALRLGHFYSMYAELIPAQANLVVRLKSSLAVSAQGDLLVARLFHLLDAYWAADGRLRTVATLEEVKTLDRFEDAVTEWTMGEPLPDSWPAAAKQLRMLVGS